jgi:hypothetical protein
MFLLNLGLWYMSDKILSSLLNRIDANDEKQKAVHHFHRDGEKDIDLYYTHDGYGFEYILPKAINYAKQREKLRERKKCFEEIEEYEKLLSVEYMK